MEGQDAYIWAEDGQAFPALLGLVEVRNGDTWRALSREDLARKTIEGWPAYAGLEARQKRGLADETNACSTN